MLMVCVRDFDSRHRKYGRDEPLKEGAEGGKSSEEEDSKSMTKEETDRERTCLAEKERVIKKNCH